VTEAAVQTMTAWVEAPDDGPDLRHLRGGESCPICMMEFCDDGDGSDDDDAGDVADGPEEGGGSGVGARNNDGEDADEGGDGGGGGGDAGDAGEWTGDDPRGIVRLSRCVGHYFHKACITRWMAEKEKCPVCAEIYGIIKGDQPDGTFDMRTERGSLPGYEGCGTLTITYNFPSGVQGEMHPNPGKPYHGTSRVGYLPDNAEGRRVAALLRTAFDRRVSFTIGTSITTGRSDCVIWNGVHHKTSKTGGPQSFGYPDPAYLARVAEELAAKGVVDNAAR